MFPQSRRERYARAQAKTAPAATDTYLPSRGSTAGSTGEKFCPGSGVGGRVGSSVRVGREVHDTPWSEATGCRTAVRSRKGRFEPS